MRDAGWHCSSCFSTLEGLRGKMAGFSHTPWNTEINRDAKTMVARVRNGEDLFGRVGEKYKRVEGNKDVPDYVLHRPDAFGYMLDRDGEDAGFSDWKPDSR
jgi:beta-1,4-mannosyl-glycoprotein beta-1,4-N-acetylglucosaminyltransferase